MHVRSTEEKIQQCSRFWLCDFNRVLKTITTTATLTRSRSNIQILCKTKTFVHGIILCSFFHLLFSSFHGQFLIIPYFARWCLWWFVFRLTFETKFGSTAQYFLIVCISIVCIVVGGGVGRCNIRAIKTNDSKFETFVPNSFFLNVTDVIDAAMPFNLNIPHDPALNTVGKALLMRVSTNWRDDSFVFW